MKKNKERPTQRYSKEYLEQSRNLSPEEIVEFLDNFRVLHSGVFEGKSRLISMKIPQPLLDAFKLKANLKKIPYQTQIKRLMIDWLK